MINDAIEANKRICVLPTQNKYENTLCVSGIPVLLQKYEDGRMDIVITGVEKVKLLQEIKSNPYQEYAYEPMYESQRIVKKEDFQLIKELLYSRLRKQPHFDEQREQFAKILQDNEAVINYSILLLFSDIDKKFKLMQLNAFDQKIQAMIDYLQPESIDIFDHINLIQDLKDK